MQALSAEGSTRAGPLTKADRLTLTCQMSRKHRACATFQQRRWCLLAKRQKPHEGRNRLGQRHKRKVPSVQVHPSATASGVVISKVRDTLLRIVFRLDDIAARRGVFRAFAAEDET